MLNVSNQERKCVKYLANEMSKSERSVFEIELSLDDDLLIIFKNFQTIWISYPNNSSYKEYISFEQIIKKHNELKNSKPEKVSVKKKVAISMVFLLVFCLGLYFIGMHSFGCIHHIIAPKGQRLTVVLPDSSTIILNSGSEIKYSSDFKKQRAIWLKGEAFFKVTKNINSPFIVHTNYFNVKVLGTEFNVSSTSLNQTVSLAKGIVTVLFKESKDGIKLIPNQELVWNSKTKLVIKRNFDVNKVCAWKDNILILDDEKFEEALPKINQFYGVNFILKDSDIANQHLKGAFKNQTIDEFITSLEFISDVSISKKGQNNIEITKYHEN